MKLRTNTKTKQQWLAYIVIKRLTPTKHIQEMVYANHVMKDC